jgi:ankyrin repeat protein
MQACGGGHLEVVNNLLDSGAGPNHSSKVFYVRAKLLANTTDESYCGLLIQVGYTALMVAALNGTVEVLRRLLESGADPSAKNKVPRVTGGTRESL